MLKQACEGDLVAVWAESDQARDVCEVALAIVSAPEDQRRLSFESVLLAWVRPKGEVRSCRLTAPGPSKYDPSILRPWPVYRHTHSALFCSTRDAKCTNCRYIR